MDSENHVISSYPSHSVMKMIFYLCDFLLNIHNPSLIMRKIKDKFQLTFYKLPDYYSQNYQGHKNEENMTNYPSQEKPEETCQVNAIQYLEWDPGTKAI